MPGGGMLHLRFDWRIFWSAPTSFFLASKMNARKCILIVAALFGGLANMAFVFTKKYEETNRPNCDEIGASNSNQSITRFGLTVSNIDHSNSSMIYPIYKESNSSNNFPAIFKSSIEQKISMLLA